MLDKDIKEINSMTFQCFLLGISMRSWSHPEGQMLNYSVGLQAALVSAVNTKKHCLLFHP